MFQKMFQKMFQEFGTVDILVNNAGIQRDAPFEEMTLADWQLVLDVNLTGQFLCAQEAVREFKRRGVVEEVSAAAGEDHFYEFCPRGGPLGWPRQLCHLQGWRSDDDEKYRSGSRALSDQSE